MAEPSLTRIGKYEVVEVLGQGGMGVVYKAMDPAIGRLVAIKMMTSGFAENPDLLQRFYREAKSTGTLQHPNIVIVHDLGEHQGNPYLVMEFLEGEPLSEMIATRRKLSLVQKLEYVIQGLNGLNYAHRRGVVHRDIKPANLMVLGDGAVKIVDFGIARLGDQRLTKTGQVMGTITYMSPEQINAQVVDGRTDIFSTGVMLYELLTFALPFEGKDTTATMIKILGEPPPPLHNFLPVSPPELETILHKALAKDREERYSTAEDFAFDLRRVQESLQKEMLSDYVEQARASLEKQELSRAKELLQQALKVDSQHQVAAEMMQQVQQRLQKQQRGEQVAQLRSHAAEALAQRQYDEALACAEQALALDKSSDKTDPELLALRDQAQQARDRKKQRDAALADAVADALHRQDHATAGKLVTDALVESPDDPVLLKLQASVARQTQPAQPVKTVVSGGPQPAQTMIAGSISGKMPAMPEPAAAAAHVSAESRGAPQSGVGHPAAPVPKKMPAALKLLIAAVALVVLATGGYFATRSAPGGLVPGTNYLEVHAVPWGMVKSVTSADGKIRIPVNQQTPVRVKVPPGNYTVVVAGPDGEEKSEECTVYDNQPGDCNAVFQKLKPRRGGR